MCHSPGDGRELQLPQGGHEVQPRRRLLHQHRLLPGHRARDQLLHHFLARVERRARPCHDRRHHHAQLLHHVQQLPLFAARRVQPEGHVHVGQRVHVLHLRVAARVRRRQLRGTQEAQTQHCLHARRECGHTGN